MAWAKHLKGSDGTSINSTDRVRATVTQIEVRKVRKVLDGANLRQASRHVTQREASGRN